MRAVRTEFGQPDVLTLASPLGPVRISHPAAAAVLRDAVDRLAEVRARSCRITQPAADPEAGGAAEVALTVTARFGVELPYGRGPGPPGGDHRRGAGAGPAGAPGGRRGGGHLPGRPGP